MNSRLRRLAALRRRLRQRIVAEAYRRCYRDPGPDAMTTAMVVGTGRSGTTWVAEVIDSQIPCRLMFEPFNPDRVGEFSRFHYFQYMPPDREHPDLLSFCNATMRGELRGPWVDGYLARLFPRLRLIKDIRPTLMLRWLKNQFPDVPVLYVLRHPCAVVLSRMRLNWATDQDVSRFLCQPQLVADHLSPYMDVIEAARTDEEKHAVVWCLSNLVPLRQFAGGGWTLLYYEHLKQRPETEVPRLFSALGVDFDSRVFSDLRLPSRTTRHTRGGTSDRAVNAEWRHDLSVSQIDRVLKVVQAFGLDHIYGDSVMPLEPVAYMSTSPQP
jgi:hypothetical protein